MFVYEKNGKLNVMFQASQIPAAGTPDVCLWKDGSTIHIQAAGEELALASNIPEVTTPAVGG